MGAPAASGAGNRTSARARSASPWRTLLLLVALAQTLFWSAWWWGYTLLPEGILRNSSGAAVLPLERLGGVGRALAVLLSRAGVLELNAYLLVAAATAGWARREQRTWWGGATRRVQPQPLGPAGWVMLAAAALLLIAGAVRVTIMWCAAEGGC